MNIKEEFEKWYATEGIREMVPKGEHWHEHYQWIAFLGGVKAVLGSHLIKGYEELVQKHDKALSEIIETLKNINNQNNDK
jgi:hypothetical protein